MVIGTMMAGTIVTATGEVIPIVMDGLTEGATIAIGRATATVVTGTANSDAWE